MLDLHLLRFDSYQDYQVNQELTKGLFLLSQEVESKIVKNSEGKETFKLSGHCYPCNKETSFLVHNTNPHQEHSLQCSTPHWRETLHCDCELNNRVRAAFHLFTSECKPSKEAYIYVTEQVTPFYKCLKKHFPNTVGSEYLGTEFLAGTIHQDNIRNESLTNLSFSDETFDFVISLDVLEHIPDYRRALAEICRSLTKNGTLILSVPFRQTSLEHLIRAVVNSDGTIHHLTNPEYHGDPLSQKGCLCFQHFGWRLLDELREIGFSEVFALNYWSRSYGYLGTNQIFIAKKASNSFSGQYTFKQYFSEEQENHVHENLSIVKDIPLSRLVLQNSGTLNMKRKILVHHHIFKNAGTSLDYALEKCFGKSFFEFDLPDNKLVTKDVLHQFIVDHPTASAISSHHVCMVVPENEEYQIISLIMLRRPLARVRSIYNFVRQQNFQAIEFIKAKELSFKEYVLWQLEYTPLMISNYQTHYCSRINDYSPDYLVTEQDLEIAISNLEKCAVVGTVENYDNTLSLAKIALSEFYSNDIILESTHLNSSLRVEKSDFDLHTSLVEELGEDIVNQLKSMNQLDEALYKVADNMLKANLKIHKIHGISI